MALTFLHFIILLVVFLLIVRSETSYYINGMLFAAFGYLLVDVNDLFTLDAEQLVYSQLLLLGLLVMVSYNFYRNYTGGPEIP